MKLRNAATVVAVAVAVAGGLAAPARAAVQDGTANNGEFVFYYNSNQAGSLSDFAANKSNLDGYEFVKSGAAGYGQSVKNNAASVRNLRGVAARVYVSNGYMGAYDTVSAESSRNLDNAYNNNASFKW